MRPVSSRQETRLAGPSASSTRQCVTAWRPRSSRDDRHLLALARVAADRRVDRARARVGPPQTRARYSRSSDPSAVVGEQGGEALVGGVGLGDDQQAGGVLVEPVDDAGPPDPADPRQAGAAMGDQRVDQRAVRMARRRMDDEAGRLVDDDQVLVLEDDVERQYPRRESGESSGGGASKAIRAPAAQLRRGVAHDRAVDA